MIWSYVLHTDEYIFSMRSKKINIGEIAKATTKNAEELFGL